MGALSETVEKLRHAFRLKVASSEFSREMERFSWRVTETNIDALIPIALTDLSDTELPPTVIDFINAGLELNTGSSLALAVGQPRGDYVQRTLSVQVRNGRDLISEVQVRDDSDNTRVLFNTFYNIDKFNSYKADNAKAAAFKLLNPNNKPDDFAHLSMARQILAFSQREFAKTPPLQPWNPEPPSARLADF